MLPADTHSPPRGESDCEGPLAAGGASPPAPRPSERKRSNLGRVAAIIKAKATMAKTAIENAMLPSGPPPNYYLQLELGIGRRKSQVKLAHLTVALLEATPYVIDVC